jgi:hypothetical protein
MLVTSETSFEVAVLSQAEEEARWRGVDSVRAEHLALALAALEEGAHVLHLLGVSPGTWREELHWMVGVWDSAQGRVRDRRQRHEGPVALDDRTVRGLLDTAAGIAAAHASEMNARHLMAAMVEPGNYNAAKGCVGVLGLTRSHVYDALGLDAADHRLPPSLGPSHSIRRGHAPLILHGGGDSRPHVFREMCRVAADHWNKPTAQLRVACIFAGTPTSTGKDELAAWHQGGADQAEDINLRGREDASGAPQLAALDEAEVIYFGGGEPTLIYKALAQTPAAASLVVLPTHVGDGATRPSGSVT